MSTTPHTPGKGPTPGPWRVGFDSLGGLAIFTDTDTGSSLCIATVIRGYFSSRLESIEYLDCEHEAKANAALIAAAPETAAERDRLRKALAQQADATEALLREIRRHPSIEWRGATILAALEAVKAARAALAATTRPREKEATR